MTAMAHESLTQADVLLEGFSLLGDALPRPGGRRHRELCTLPFVKPVSLPAPFDFEPETSAFV
ncbi:hypothetical protein [Streptomyces sp. NPDC058695]|uniref:hypothetical protein n=1 Tax=Streptomyces sp. NPDC058695 TaxID=3346604 RepID=UPI00364CBDBB